MEFLKFKTFVAEAKKPLPAIQTIGLKSNQPKGNSSTKIVKEENGHLDKLHKSLSKHYKFNTNDHWHIQYITHDSQDINHKLWEKHHNPEEKVYPWQKQVIKSTDRILHKHTTPHHLHVYTGIPHHPKHYNGDAEIHHPVTFHHPSYLHTSLNHKTAKDFSTPARYDGADHIQHHNPKSHETHVLHIHIPKGHHGAYVAHHSAFDDQDQKEFILPRGTKLKIHPHPKISHHEVFGVHHKVHTWHTTIEK